LRKHEEDIAVYKNRGTWHIPSSLPSRGLTKKSTLHLLTTLPVTTLPAEVTILQELRT
jgi:hypothetical protein